MALRPTNDAALLQEVDEAVRRTGSIRSCNAMAGGSWRVLPRCWRLGAIFTGVITQETVRGERAEELVAAFEKLAGSQPAAANGELQKLAAGSEPAYRAVAVMQQANIKAQNGDLKGAAALMAGIVADKKIDQALRDLALIRQTAFEYDSLKPEAVIARMKPLVDARDPASSWFASAAELSAAHYQLGQYDQAGRCTAVSPNC